MLLILANASLLVFLDTTYFYAKFNYGLIDILKSLQLKHPSGTIRYDNILDLAKKRWRRLNPNYINQLLLTFLRYYEQINAIRWIDDKHFYFTGLRELHKIEINISPREEIYKFIEDLRRKTLKLRLK